MLMRATGRGSISSFLKLAVDIAWVIACALLGFIWIIAAISIFSMVSGGEPIAAFERIAIASPRGLTLWTLTGTILCLGAMIVCAYLRGVFETLVNGDPFVPGNARRFTAIAIVLAIMEGSSMLMTTIVLVVLSAFGIEGGPADPILPKINWPVWFAVLTLMVLAQVFREGAAMREEQKMTI